MNHRSFKFAACVASLAVCVAPVSDAGAKKKHPSFRACSLIKKSDVAAAIGEPVKQVQGDRTQTGASYCNWFGNDSNLYSKGVSLIAAIDHPKPRYKQYKALLNHPTAVKGIGDAAATDGEVLIARKGRAFIHISALYNHSGVTLDSLKPLAIKALKKAA
jgi:hypothetical protein